jgi:hypothetical protein
VATPEALDGPIADDRAFGRPKTNQPHKFRARMVASADWTPLTKSAGLQLRPARPRNGRSRRMLFSMGQVRKLGVDPLGCLRSLRARSELDG